MSQELVTADLNRRMMDNWAASQLIDLAAEYDAKTKGDLWREMNAVAVELAGANPSPAERMLAQVAALNWFALRLHEARYAAGCNSEKGMTLIQSEHAQHRIDRTHRRLMTSLKTLVTVKTKLGVPAVQINLAHQQVNVASSAP